MIGKLIKFLLAKDIRIFLITLIFHFSLYFSTSNKITFLLSFFLLIALYQHLKKIPLTLFFTFIIMLPFAKGKGIDILLLDKKFVLKNAIFDIRYLFPIYFFTFYLGLFYLYYLRTKLFFVSQKIVLKPNLKLALLALSLFIVCAALNASFSLFEIPILLASLQILILLLIFMLPFALVTLRRHLTDLYLLIASSTLFQSVWLILQTLNHGHLHRDIEVFLPGAEFGIRSSENQDIARLTGTFFESSILGTFLVTNLVILMMALVKNKLKSQKQKQVLVFTNVLAVIAVILTGSRAIYVILLLVLLLVGMIGDYISKPNLTRLFRIFITQPLYLILVAGGIILTTPFLLNRLSSSSQMFSPQGSGTYRLQISQLALRLTEKRPWLGVGLDLSPYYLATSFPQEDYFVDPAHPHNLFIQLLAETGLIGTSLFLLFIYLIFRPMLTQKITKINEFAWGSLIFLLSAQIYPIFINQMEIISYLFLYLGLAAYLQQNYAQK